MLEIRKMTKLPEQNHLTWKVTNSDRNSPLSAPVKFCLWDAVTSTTGFAQTACQIPRARTEYPRPLWTSNPVKVWWASTDSRALISMRSSAETGSFREILMVSVESISPLSVSRNSKMPNMPALESNGVFHLRMVTGNSAVLWTDAVIWRIGGSVVKDKGGVARLTWRFDVVLILGVDP